MKPITTIALNKIKVLTPNGLFNAFKLAEYLQKRGII